MAPVTWLLPSRPERAVFRLRKWIILRLVSIVDSLHLEKEEALIEEVARCEMCSNHNSPWVEQPKSWASCLVLVWVPPGARSVGVRLSMGSRQAIPVP